MNTLNKKDKLVRYLRKNMTSAERLLWEQLRGRRFQYLKFRRQHILSGFVVDFYCHRLSLAIEIDGDVHNDQKEYDQIRQQLIENEGIRFARFTNKEIFTQMDNVLKRIEALSRQ